VVGLPETEGQALTQYRSPGGSKRSTAPTPRRTEQGEITRVPIQRARGSHRLPPPPSALRGRVAVAAVALGAFTAAAYGGTLTPSHGTDGVKPLADTRDAGAAFGIGGDAVGGAPEVLPIQRGGDAASEAQKLTATEKVTADLAAAEAAKQAEQNRPLFVKPAQGTFTSGFGGRWGAFHYGIDIANVMDTPIVAAADGVVIDAGPASGFGLWVRIRLDDGTINVYGHMDTFSVHVGQHVQAGEQIAKMGDRGESTGVHLHFEVWDPSGKKINPIPWLNARGITV
jgi:murein DD-endopeptidase MepM/ murein hydrolase activator NlpD